MSELNSAGHSLDATPSAPSPDFRLLFESAPGLYLVLTPELDIVAVSDAYLTATMLPRDQVLGRGIFEVFPDNPDDPEATGVRNLQASLNRVCVGHVADAMAVQKYDIRRPDAEGGGFEERYWSPVNLPVLGTDQELIYIIHRVEDVTEFLKARQRESEQAKLAEVLRTRGEQMEAEIFRRAQQLQDANVALRASQSELEDRVRERTRELAEANEALRAEIRLTQTLEEQVRQAQKMEAIGTLAGGVAHDFNNLLTVISGCGELLLMDRQLSSNSQFLVEQIRSAASRAASLTRQLLAFSRQQVLEPRLLDLNVTISNTETMLRRLIGEDIQLVTNLSPKIGQIRADPGQLEQVIMNLAVNARDAMPQGGRLIIETAVCELDTSYTMSHVEVKPGRYVQCSVSDSGVGMDDATRNRIFEPFFTTKAQGRGTGLGLATVFGIMKQSGGHIWVYSELGHGTTFKLYFPETDTSEHTLERAPQEPVRGGNETILLVEDEEAVRDVTTLALAEFGYAVISASGGAMALTMCENHTGPIHLLITDVIMPEMGGRLVAEAVQALRPEIKVLYLSGYTDDAVVRHGILHEQVAFLQKPFTPDGLARKVRRVLDGFQPETKARQGV